MLIPIIFLVLSTAFVVTLLRGIMQLLGEEFKHADSLAGQLWRLFKLPILIFIVFLLFVLVILPRMEQMGY